MPRPTKLRRTKTAVVGKLVGTAAISVAMLATVATPASADDSSYYPNSKPCQSGARYAIGWDNANNHVFGRDCKADGYGILVDAWANGNFLGDVWDHSHAGNGVWNPTSGGSEPNNSQVKLVVWQTKGGYAVGSALATFTRDYHTSS